MKRALLLAILAACHAGPKWTEHDKDAHVTLIRLEIATDGMGFENDRPPALFSNDAVQPTGELYACPDRMERATRGWGRRSQLSITRADVHPQEVVFYFVPDDASGRFELVYRRTRFTALYPNAWPVPANENKEVLVTAELIYTSRPANAGDAALKRLVASYAIESFMHELSAAMSCGPDGKPRKLERPD